MGILHSTAAYHRHIPVDLMTELTVCESLADVTSPAQCALDRPRAYGALIGDFLRARGLLFPGIRLAEIGGGYGSLMRDLLAAHGDLVAGVLMIDLSKHLLTRQRQNLAPWQERVRLVRGDVLEMIPALCGVDLVIANEMMGDLDVMLPHPGESWPDKVRSLADDYGLNLPPDGPFNLGAVNLVAALARARIPALLTEHAADPIIPGDLPWLARGLAMNGRPRRIELHEHAEYTIRFEHLQQTAGTLGRTVETGPLADIVGLSRNPELRFVFLAGACSTPRQEVLGEFVDHVREYRWLMMR